MSKFYAVFMPPKGTSQFLATDSIVPFLATDSIVPFTPLTALTTLSYPFMSGIVMMKVVPWPKTDSALIWPPWSWTIFQT